MIKYTILYLFFILKEFVYHRTHKFSMPVP